MAEPQTRGPDYPAVYCQRHDTIAAGYVICRHVMAGAEISSHCRDSPESLGQILCARDHTEHELVVVCKQCAMEITRGRLPA